MAERGGSTMNLPDRRPPEGAGNSAERSMKVLVVETKFGGHNLEYVAHVAQYGLASGWRVSFLTSQEAVRSRQAGMYLGECLEEMEVVVTCKANPGLREIAEVAARVSATLVVVLDGDRLTYKLGRGARWPCESALTLLMMRSPWLSPSGVARRDLTKKVLAQIAGRRRHIELRHLGGPGARGSDRIVVCRDPVSIGAPNSIGTAVELDLLESDRYWYGVLGVVTSRKNAPLILDALTAPEFHRCGLVVAGEISPDVLLALRHRVNDAEEFGVRVIIVDRLLEASTLDEFVRRIDCLVLAHGNEGPSGLLLKAAAAGTPVIAAGAESLRNDCLAIGETWVPLTRDDLRSALLQKPMRKGPSRPEVPGPMQFAASLLGILS